MLNEDKIKKIELLAREYNILAIYLFGSRVTGDTGPLSDYDFGILPNKKLSIHEELAIIREFQYLFNADVDIIFLDDAGLNIAYEIIRTGIKIFVADREKVIDFEHQLMMEFLDFRHILDMYSKETRRWAHEIK